MRASEPLRLQKLQTQRKRTAWNLLSLLLLQVLVLESSHCHQTKTLVLLTLVPSSYQRMQKLGHLLYLYRQKRTPALLFSLRVRCQRRTLHSVQRLG